MKTKYHIQITEAALNGQFSSKALNLILEANIGQDSLVFQVGHDHFHYDNDSFQQADAYVEKLRNDCLEQIRQAKLIDAWRSYGRLTHTIQDFYAHSNYIEIMLKESPGAEDLPIREPGSKLPDGIRSGKLYYPWEVITFIPGFPEKIKEFFPPDSHARMNKDAPERKYFKEAFKLAVSATLQELGKITMQLSDYDKLAFFDKADHHKQ